MNTYLRYGILLLFIACLGSVVYQTVRHKVGDYGMETDIYRFYAPTAHAFEQGRIEIDDFHPPLYGWIIGLITMTRIFPGEFEASLFLSVLSYIAVVLLIGLIARQSFPDTPFVCWFAAAIVGSNPTLMEHACRSDVHIVYLALSLASIYYVLRKNAWLAGLLVAIAIWTRYTWMLSVIPLFFLPRKKLLPGWGIAALAWVGLGLLTLRYKGVWLYSLNHVSVAAGLYNVDLPTNVGLWIQRHETQFKDLSLIQILLYNPLMAARTIVTHIGLFSYKALVYLMVLPTGLLAVFGLRKTFWGNYRHPLLLWTLVFFAILVMTFWDKQYVLGLIPLFGLAAALQLADLPFSRVTRWILFPLLAGLAVWGGIAVDKAMMPGPVAVREMASLMRAMPGKTVVSRDPRVFYYSGKEPGEVLLTPSKNARVTTDYIFVSSYELARNDTLFMILKESDFEKKCENVTPLSSNLIKILKVKEQYVTPVTTGK